MNVPNGSLSSQAEEVSLGTAIVGRRFMVPPCRYYGPVHWDLSGTTYVGLALDQRSGSVAGTVEGVRYLDAPKGHAAFLKASLLVPESDAQH